MRGIQDVAGQSFAEHAKGSRKSRLFHLAPRGYRPDDDLDYPLLHGETVRMGGDLAERRAIFARVCDVYIVVEGGPGSTDEAEKALKNGAIVIPIRRCGGAAGGMFNFPLSKCKKPESISDADWTALSNDTQSPREVAAAVARMVAACLELQAPPPAPTMIDHVDCELVHHALEYGGRDHARRRQDYIRSGGKHTTLEREEGSIGSGECGSVGQKKNATGDRNAPLYDARSSLVGGGASAAAAASAPAVASTSEKDALRVARLNDYSVTPQKFAVGDRVERTSVFHTLLNVGADPWHVDHHKQTVLMAAAMRGHTEAARVLIRHLAYGRRAAGNALYDAADGSGELSSDEAAKERSVAKIDDAAVERSIKKMVMARQHEGWGAIGIAAWKGHNGVLDTVLAEFYSILSKSTDRDEAFAIAEIRKLVNDEYKMTAHTVNAKPDAPQRVMRRTALHLSSEAGRWENVKSLLYWGADLLKLDDGKRSALLIAASLGRQDAVWELTRGALGHDPSEELVTTVKGTLSLAQVSVFFISDIISCESC